ncbi:hypothetical protein DDI_0929 [Dickeya dianthicola RNS04.9]|nr:hypothetical protein DDI_0929 [Dickeya dianthicola RNS04.9]
MRHFYDGVSKCIVIISKYCRVIINNKYYSMSYLNLSGINKLWFDC